MSFDELQNRIKEAWSKAENREKKLAELFDEIFPSFDDKELKEDIINSILAETIYSNDPIAQDALKRIKNKYK
jgi:hypothetical protein